MKVGIFSECFHNVEPFRPEVYVAPGLVSSQAPYLVGLVERENPETIICAGSLLNYRWVLTLASCTQEKKHNNKKYKVGGILRQKQNKIFFLKNQTDCGAKTWWWILLSVHNPKNHWSWTFSITQKIFGKWLMGKQLTWYKLDKNEW